MIVVSAFLRSVRATIIPAVATAVSLLGTFAVMYLLGFSLNNLSLMALTVATGFVVDDAIVVLENTSRHIEAGMDRFKAALLGAREVGFTVLSISLSLVAVFIPLLFMGGQVGRLFREFAVTLVRGGDDLAGHLADHHADDVRLAAGPTRMSGRRGGCRAGSSGVRRGAARLRAQPGLGAVGALAGAGILALVIGLNVYLFIMIPKGFFPQQDTGQIQGGLRADQSISFQAMQEKLASWSTSSAPTRRSRLGGLHRRRAGRWRLPVRQPKARRRALRRGQAVIARLRPQLAT